MSFEADPEALAIWRELRRAGHEALFCGGCVRDFLLGRLAKDWDLATSATPDQIAALFERTVDVGRAFGVMVVVREERNFEVATFRRDREYRDGRRPEGVEFCSAEEDARRRDFTVNALFYNPDREAVVDYVGGRPDLAARIIRAVGEPRERFYEDHLRLLRAVRFAARLGFALEERTQAAVAELAGLVRTLPGERVGGEIWRLLTEGGARRGLELLARTNLLWQILPEVAALRGVPQPPEFHPEGDVWEHTLLMLELMDRAEGEWRPQSADEREILGWAVLLHDIGKPPTITRDDRIRFNEHDRLGAEMAAAVLERMKRPRRIIDTVADLIARHIHFASLGRMRKAKLRQFLREPEFPLHLELHRLDCASSHRQLENYRYGLAAWREEMATPPPLTPLLTGRDLMALGFKPGPLLGRTLAEVAEARLEGEVETYEQALALARIRLAAAES